LAINNFLVLWQIFEYEEEL